LTSDVINQNNRYDKLVFPPKRKNKRHFPFVVQNRVDHLKLPRLLPSWGQEKGQKEMRKTKAQE
jgi:hypothetical protein